jgi:hypothetical protein
LVLPTILAFLIGPTDIKDNAIITNATEFPLPPLIQIALMNFAISLVF